MANEMFRQNRVWSRGDAVALNDAPFEVRRGYREHVAVDNAG